MVVPAEKSGCLRREYLKKNEDAPLSENKGDFTLYGHRLSSLFRKTMVFGFWLMNRYPASFFQKYSNPSLSTGASK